MRTRGTKVQKKKERQKRKEGETEERREGRKKGEKREEIAKVTGRKSSEYLSNQRWQITYV